MAKRVASRREDGPAPRREPYRQGLQGAGNVDAKITGSKVCWKFTKLKGFGTPLVAHIHEVQGGQVRAGLHPARRGVQGL